jgi:arylsulfatase A-like enzyme
MTTSKRPNILLFAIDSIRADRLSSYGYKRLTTPHIDRFAAEGVSFENTYSAHIPTTPAYASMLTGMDCFSTQVVALRHVGGLRPEVSTMAEILRDFGYNTTCVGFTGNPSSRGYDKYLDYAGWGTWNEGRSPKAQNLNDVALPELNRLIDEDKPWYVMLRHMDPHMPYLPPVPFERMFYQGNETDPDNHSMDPVMSFKPFKDFFAMSFPPGITDKDYVIAQYDGAIAYMDSCIESIFTLLRDRGVLEDTIVVINGDHGETLYDHDIYFDHHGIYDNILHVPLIIRYPAKLPQGVRIKGYNQHKDLLPTVLELADLPQSDIKWASDLRFDGKSLLPMIRGEVASHDSGFYITECTWMRKHGWRTPEWKLMLALEPDLHFKPPVELYNLIEDPEENNNLAEARPDVVKHLTGIVNAWVAKRTAETGKKNPMLTQPNWHGHKGKTKGVGRSFTSSQQAYDTFHIGDPKQAAQLQAADKKDESEEAEEAKK